MNKSTLALSALTLALAAGLSACGGGKSTHVVGVTVTGLQYGPLVLTTNGMEISLMPKGKKDGKVLDVTDSFPNELEYGETYNVTMKQTGTGPDGKPTYQQPPHQVCAPTGGNTETAGRLATINATFGCELVKYSIGGTVTGLTGTGLKLINGSNGGVVPVDKDGAFTFAAPVTYDQTYGVTVLDQPTGQFCTVDKGAGIMKDEPITSIVVTCRAG